MTRKKFIRLLLLVLLACVLVYYFYPEEKLPANAHIDKIIVYKSKRQLLACSKDQLLKTYTISLGKNPVGDKEYEGDKRTPEGSYTINTKNPNSGYYKNLGISYPNKTDIANAKRKGKACGGDIKIHGIRNHFGFIGKFQRWYDWTAGCMALTDDEVDELYSAVDVGTPIDIRH